MSKNKIYISAPMNVYRNIFTELKKICPNSEVCNYHSNELIYLKNIKEGKMDEVPDMLISTCPEILWERDYLNDSNLFDNEYRYDINTNLESKKLLDDKWVLKPIYVMPIVIFYNKDMKNPPQAWNDLLEPRFKGKIITTNVASFPAILFKQFYKHTLGQKGEDFVENDVEYLGSPIDVNKAVSSKQYDIGIISLPFAMFSRNNSTAISWPKEGALHLTQVMIMKKGYSEETKKAADFLVSQKAQEIFSKNASFVPVVPNVEIPKYYKENNTTLFWKDWDDFIAMAKK